MNLFNTLKKENPEKGEEFYNTAVEHLGKENWEETFKNISESISYRSDFSTSYYVRAVCYMNLKKYDCALNDFNKAITLEEKDFFYFYRGVLYKTLQKYSEALSDFNKTLELNSNYIESYSMIAQVNFYLNNYEESIKNYDKVIDLEPDNADAYSFRGYNRTWLRNFDLGLTDINKAISLNPNNSLYYFHLASTYMLMIRFDEARKNFQKSYELGDTDALTMLESLGNRSFIKFKEIEATTLPTVNEDEAKLFLSHLSPNDGFMFDGIKKPKASLFYSLKYAFPRHCFGDAYLLSIDVPEFLTLCRSSQYNSLEPILKGKVLGRLHMEFGGDLHELEIEVKPMEL